MKAIMIAQFEVKKKEGGEVHSISNMG